MENSVLLAKFIGPFIVVIGIGILFNIKTYLRIMEDFFKNAALVYVTGLVTFVAGLSIVLFHNIWIFDWRMVITIFGWNSLIKGAFLIICPAISAKITNIFIRNIKLMIIPWIVMLAIGILLTVKGY